MVSHLSFRSDGILRDYLKSIEVSRYRISVLDLKLRKKLPKDPFKLLVVDVALLQTVGLLLLLKRS